MSPQIAERVVILGASGFLGLNLAQALACKTRELICFSRSPVGPWPVCARVITGDFEAPPAALMDALEDAVVFHLVGSSRPHQRTGRAADEINTEVAATLRCLERTKGRRLRWVFVSSGGTVYGPTAGTIPEDSPTRPICSYGLVKLMLEKYFALYHQLHGTDHVVARLANPYGAWQSPLRGQGLVATLIHKALRGERVEIWGDGSVVRDYLHVDDTAQALLDIAEHGASGEAYNVGSGIGCSISALTQLISRTLDVRIDTLHAGARTFDVPHNVLDNTRLRRLAGWQPTLTLEDGIRKTADWMIGQDMVKR